MYLLLGEVMNVYVQHRELVSWQRSRRELAPEAWQRAAKRELASLESPTLSEGHGEPFWPSRGQEVSLERSDWHGESLRPSEGHQEPLESSEWLELLGLEESFPQEWQEAPPESLRPSPPPGAAPKQESLAASRQRLRQARVCHFRALDATYRAFDARVALCRPSAVQMSMIRLPEALRLHMGLFEVVRNTCRLYMLLYLRQVQPASPPVQQILLESMELLEALADTTIVAALPMVLLVCGIACLEPSDRRAMAAIYRRVYAQYTVGNVARVWAVVEEFWARNPGGQLCIDWADICEERGWRLSVC